MKILSGFMQSSGGSSPGTTHHQNGIYKEGLMTGQEETGGTGYLFGKMVSATLQLLVVVEDLSFVVLLRKKFSYLESIPGVLLPHPSSTAFPIKMDAQDNWPFHGTPAALAPPMEIYDHHFGVSQQVRITPSMSSLEALLSKLPSVGPGPGTTAPSPSSSGGYYEGPMIVPTPRPPQLELIGMERMVKEEMEEYGHEGPLDMPGESSSSISPYYLNLSKPSDGF
ncbi:hypothetical protein J5N97_005063 [Dioscorea zingiberensis]|uniref:Uncharacterized protein n=1 Tax=Dioscorea zingiberensis TaxID=325984 RepID=A0A9D5D947_9LILI|nr:hypothetical protein J5N97_005063 [Dioscorea zingiberensis]